MGLVLFSGALLLRELVIRIMESNNLEHHKRFEYCHNRLQYRSSKVPTAVKVFDVNMY